MDFGNQVTKDTLRQLLDQTPNLPQNASIRNSLINLITAKNIQAIPYTYNAIYWVTGAANALAAGATNVPFQIGIQADADFLVLNQTYDCNTANAARTLNTLVVPNVLVTITDTGSGMQLMDAATPVTNIFGMGYDAYVLPSPKLFTAKSTIQVLATNIDAAAGYNLRLSFNGVKLYSYQ